MVLWTLHEMKCGCISSFNSIKRPELKKIGAMHEHRPEKKVRVGMLIESDDSSLFFIWTTTSLHEALCQCHYMVTSMRNELWLVYGFVHISAVSQKMDSILRLENRRRVAFLSELAYFSVGFYRFQKGSFSETVPKIWLRFFPLHHL